MKLISQQKALELVEKLKGDFKSQILGGYEHRAKSCLTCEVQGSCCLDAHFVNVHISRLEAVGVRRVLERLPEELRNRIYRRIENTVEKYELKSGGDTYSQTYACPLFAKGTGCLVHNEGKPVPCITHACYTNASDLPPDELQIEQERRIDDLNRKTYGRSEPWLPIPLAILNSR
jgi:hypothetical protein